jgi:Zn-dependent M28 family amino/carboxypeptidase
MKLARYHLTPDSRSAKLDAAVSLGASWVQFGNELLLYTDDNQWEGLVGRAGQRTLQLQEHPETLKRENMHLIVQKGRLFQQERPEVPVIVDHGRFLLVELDPNRAQQLAVRELPCYTIRPLENNQVVFDVPVPTAARAPVAWVQNLVDQVSRASFEADLIHLVSYPTRFSTSTHYADAVTWARGQLEAMNYSTQLQSITVNGSNSQNVIADKLGNGTGQRDVIFVTAHLDSINHQDGQLSSAPGADDNGSGSAGLLQIARVFQNYPNVHDLHFVLFGGEEQGLFGSKQFVANLSAPEQQRIRAVINMDMIGSLNSPSPSVLLEGSPLSQNIINGLLTAATTYTQLTVQTSLNPFDSDHVPFINNGIPAVLTIEGADGANDRIHSSKDTLEHINYELALEILRMNIAFVASISSGEIETAPASAMH